jgi:GNAT superfamily N-acetyltransferase
MKSSYGLYLEELTNRKIHEDEKGFFIYQITGAEFYVQEVFVKKEFRRQNVATDYDKIATDMAKAEGCTYIKGSIIPALSTATSSMKFQLSLGFSLLYCDKDIIYLKKEIGE